VTCGLAERSFFEQLKKKKEKKEKTEFVVIA
jgi:hypothetical protein